MALSIPIKVVPECNEINKDKILWLFNALLLLQHTCFVHFTCSTPPKNTFVVSRTFHVKLFLPTLSAYSLLHTLTLPHRPIASCCLCCTHAVPRHVSSSAVLSPVRSDTTKEGRLRPTLPSLSHFDGHHIPLFGSTLLTVQWCEQTAPPPRRFVTFSEPEWQFRSVNVLWCFAWLLAWLMAHLAFVRYA